MELGLLIPAAHDDGTLERAVRHAVAEARAGDVILLSPACASYDQYDDFEARGEDFRRLSRTQRE
jgi:UDP-N-acetylmuramoylalanine--D-glutamate ligase